MWRKGGRERQRWEGWTVGWVRNKGRHSTGDSQDPDIEGSLLPLNTEDRSVRWKGSSNENKGES